MEKSRVAHRWAEEEGLSIREAERVIESEMFLDEYPQWELGTPHQTVILHEMFLHAAEQGWKEAECMCCWGRQSHIPEPNPEADESTMELVGYQMSRREMQDIYHSVYLLWRCPGSPSCGASRRRRAIQDILSSLQTRLQRQMYSAKTEGPGAHGRERVGTEPPQSYEAALWATCQKALETAEASAMTLRGLTMNVEEGHESIAWIEVAAGPVLEVATGPGQEVAQGSSQGTGLETNQEESKNL